MSAPAITYRLETLRDVFEQVPADRIQACLEEIGRGMAYTRAVGDLMGEQLTLELPIEWTDDGKTDKTVSVREGSDGPVAFTFEARSADDGGDSLECKA